MQRPAQRASLEYNNQEQSEAKTSSNQEPIEGVEAAIIVVLALEATLGGCVVAFGVSGVVFAVVQATAVKLRLLKDALASRVLSTVAELAEA